MVEQEAEIVFNKKVAKDTCLMGIKSDEIASEAKPGQFLMLRVRSGIDPLLRRPFSICAVREGGLIQILYKIVGRGTDIMSKSLEGDQISVLGPLGRGFEIPGQGKRAILVAGGMGLAPLVFLADEIGKGDFDFFMGFRSSDELVPLKVLGISDKEVIIATEDGTVGYRGLVTEMLEDHLNVSDRKSLSVFACGPVQMIKKVVAITADLGISCQVSLEASMACGIGACQGCAVKSASGLSRTYVHVCQDGPVFNIGSLDWKAL